MWIIGQDETLLADFTAVYTDGDGTIRGDIAGVSSGDNLGQYTTTERAKDVLDDIASAIQCR
jgi:hypothetical protein